MKEKEAKVAARVLSALMMGTMMLPAVEKLLAELRKKEKELEKKKVKC